MSLINRVLRDLSGRETPPTNVMSGIQVSSAGRPRRTALRRAVIVIVLVAVFTAVLWPLLKRAPTGMPATAPATSARQPPAAAPRFQLDTEMSPAPAAPTAPVRPAPRRQKPADLQLEGALQQDPAARRPDREPAPPRAAPAPAAAPAVEPVPRASARDVREADARQAEAARALGRGEPRTAEEGFRDALALNPRQHAAREALVLLLLDQGRLAEAQATLDDGLAVEPDRIAFRRLAARLDLARGQPGAAVARLEPAPPSLAADPEYHGLLASAYQRLNRHDEAARTYQSLMQLQPGEPHWWAGYGLSRDALGDAAGALAAYRQARQLGRLDPRVLEHINRRTAILQAAE